MTNSSPSALTFYVKSRKYGKFKFKMTTDGDFIEKAFMAVKINIKLTHKSGYVLELPILPKIKDDKGNVYCELDDEGERILKEYVGLQDWFL